ncbi:MAG: peptidase M12 [Verrucomicrobia bacterium]|nr:peptidase M12 [Verrucomicrobiota bacterium]
MLDAVNLLIIRSNRTTMANKIRSTNHPYSPLACTPKRLHPSLRIQAAQKAVQINPVNHAPVQRLSSVIPGYVALPEHIALVTTKYWGAQGVRLTVGFLDGPEAALRSLILKNMNAWNATANVRFEETQGQAQVRIARQDGPEGGYWSYLGTDILSIDVDQPTMNLEGFTMRTLESEFHRVVRHETGHTMGFPHEHMRQELVDKIDPEKAIEFFGRTQGWSPEEVREQVLTPIETSSLLGTPTADPNSIMCYQIPGSITKDGQPIVGGLDIDPSDFSFAQSIYPKVITGFSLKKNSEASAVDSVDEAEGATVLEFSHGELTRITLKHSASNS